HRPDERTHRGDPARLSGDRLALPRPRVAGVPDEEGRQRLCANPDGGVAGQRVLDGRSSSCPGCPSPPAPRPTTTTPTGQLRLARTQTPARSALRDRGAAHRPSNHPRLPNL